MLPKPRCIGNQPYRRNPHRNQQLGPQPNQQLNLRLGPHLGSQRNPRHSPRRNHSPGRINSGLKPIPARCNVRGVRWLAIS